MTPRSIKTITNVKFVLDNQLPAKFQLEIVDVFKNPQRARKAQIMATPTLIKKSPLPNRTIVGNITGRDRIIKGLNLRELKNSV